MSFVIGSQICNRLHEALIQCLLVYIRITFSQSYQYFIPFKVEYTGELLTKDEARERIAKIEENKEMNYILSVKEVYQNAQIETVVDARHKGNAARFANHSCSPNAVLIPIHVENEFPRIALFAKMFIPPDVEITYNYGESNSVLGHCFKNIHLYM